jgi:hypothetical protein
VGAVTILFWNYVLERSWTPDPCLDSSETSLEEQAEQLIDCSFMACYGMRMGFIARGRPLHMATICLHEYAELKLLGEEILYIYLPWDCALLDHPSRATHGT